MSTHHRSVDPAVDPAVDLENGDRHRAEGIVTERIQDAGTRAERPEMVLVDDAGVETPIHVIGDNPYAPSTLRELLGKRIGVYGTWRGQTLRVRAEDIRVMPGDPA